MVSIEKGCHWYFPQLGKGIEEKNTTDSDEETLKNQSSIEALVRESIQNSLDVHDGSNNPVVMTYKYGSIKEPQNQIPAFLDIKKYIQGSKEYILSTGNDDAPIVFDPMLNFMEEHKDIFPYLCVSDSNTVGMDPYRFHAFTSKGSSFKSRKGTGGSYGIGKAAYYMASNIRTILVSSLYNDQSGQKQVVFEGFAKLTTNVVDSAKHYDKGYYDISEAEPIKDQDSIPEVFQRTEPGTSIFVMGIDDSPEKKDNLFKSIVHTVIKNFWLAIHEEKLKVIVSFENDEIHTCEINPITLKDFINSYAKFDIKGEYNSPRPYYEAVISAVEYKEGITNPDAVYFVYNHKEYGSARFYLINNGQKHDRYLRMRSPRMVVSYEKGGKRGFNGVLVCDGKWNELLTHAEPPAHDAWDKNRIIGNKKIEQDEKVKAIDALVTINKWVSNCINTYFNENIDNDVEFFGIKDLLYTDKDFGSNSRQNGDSNSEDEGTPSNIEGEYGIMTSKSLGVDGEEQVKVRPIASVTAIKKATTKPDEKGKLRGKKRKKHTKPDPHIKREKKPGTKFPVSEDEKGKKGKYREIFDVTVRCFRPSSPDGSNLYTMVIYSKRKIEKAMVELITGTALGTTEVPIEYSDTGTFTNNTICDIPIEPGMNTIHFRFNDNIPHCTTVVTYEFK